MHGHPPAISTPSGEAVPWVALSLQSSVPGVWAAAIEFCSKKSATAVPRGLQTGSRF